MTNLPRSASIDGAVAFGLVVALGVVFLADRGTPAAAKVEPELVVVQPPEEPVIAAAPLRLAVTPAFYDDMGKLLNELGAGYKHTNISLEDLESQDTLSRYDVIFFTCGFAAKGWVAGSAIGDGGRPGVQTYRWNEEALDRLHTALRSFVTKGGTLYASDWRFSVIERCFPELTTGANAEPGAAQTVRADVVDPGLKARIGDTAELKFDLGDWKPARLSASDATVYLRGRYRTVASGEMVESPLLVRVPFGQGSIIFTSFHNEKVNSELETKLLEFLVFTAVTAKETQKSRSTMLSGGFKPQSESLIDASSTSKTVSQTYDHKHKGKLRFALSFNNQGASLKLSVRSPAGSVVEKEGVSSFSVDIDQAETGSWTYTITALKLPHEHFPYSLTIGED